MPVDSTQFYFEPLFPHLQSVYVIYLPSNNEKTERKNAHEEKKIIRMSLTCFHMSDISNIGMRVNPGCISH